MKRIIVHWTAGTYKASSLDKEHYHYIIDGEAKVIHGNYHPQDNESPMNKDHYAAHTKGTNTDSIGIALCAMAGAIENPLSYGDYPIREHQWNMMVRTLIPQLCQEYEIPVTPETILSHAEVQGTLGKPQDGKWDISVLPHRPEIVGATAVGDFMREQISMNLAVS